MSSPSTTPAHKKEEVSYTYKGHDGYAPIAASLGLEEWWPEVELRLDSQHSQEGFVPFMKRMLKKARTLTNKNPLVRLDSAHDALVTRILLRESAIVSQSIKWNPRREDKDELYRKPFTERRVAAPVPVRKSLC